jgi:hypothetical protein
MNETLFDVPEHLSPKLQWMRASHIETVCMGTEWVCRTYGYTRGARGQTEEEAILAYCEKFGLRHYSLG